jgi:hypothetical protein
LIFAIFGVDRISIILYNNSVIRKKEAKKMKNKNREKAEKIIKRKGVCLLGAHVSRDFHSVRRDVDDCSRSRLLLLSSAYSTDVVEITQWKESELYLESRKRIEALIDTSTDYIIAFVYIEERYHNNGLYEKISYVYNDEKHAVEMLLEKEIRKALPRITI